MVSDFRKKKLQYVFHFFFDVDKSGSVDQKDFDAALQKAAAVRGWKAGDDKYVKAKEALNKIWQGLKTHGDSDNDGEVTLAEWTAMWEAYDSKPLDWQSLAAKYIFNLEDTSSDGSVDCEEYSSVFAAYGVAKDQAKAAFQKMSKGKAEVTWADFQTLWTEYFTSEDVNAAGNFIFGTTTF